MSIDELENDSCPRQINTGICNKFLSLLAFFSNQISYPQNVNESEEIKRKPMSVSA
jgi:hypothetical protein